MSSSVCSVLFLVQGKNNSYIQEGVGEQTFLTQILYAWEIDIFDTGGGRHFHKYHYILYYLPYYILYYLLYYILYCTLYYILAFYCQVSPSMPVCCWSACAVLCSLAWATPACTVLCVTVMSSVISTPSSQPWPPSW